MSEFSFINYIRKHPLTNAATALGPQDDTAVIRHPQGGLSLFAADTLVEGVHFLPDTPLPLVGRKALAVNLSDLAAMGGAKDISALVCLSIPRHLSPNQGPEAVFGGMTEMAKQFGVAIVGGDTTSGSSEWVISISVLGFTEEQRIVKRSGARIGDHIWVSGPLGDSLATRKHLLFLPRLREADILVEHFKINAMIDISDGLINDLSHILNESGGLSGILDASSIPLSPSLASLPADLALQQACCDGEDFELLFTLSAEESRKLTDKRDDLGLPQTMRQIGEIIASKEQITKVFWHATGREISYAQKGYEHRWGEGI